MPFLYYEMLFQTCITFILLCKTKEYILKNVYNQTGLVPIGFHCINILLNLFFCVKQKNKMHQGLK